jgi:hypothetical protein
MTANNAKTDGKQNERIRALEVQMEGIKDMITEIKDMVTVKLPKLVKDGFTDLRKEMKEEHRKDFSLLEDRVKKNETRLEGLDVFSFIINHPKLSFTALFGLYLFGIQDVRSFVLSFL